MEYEAVIGLEVHAELETRSKMFCACPVVDVTVAAANSAVCPVCAGMPGVLPVVNRRAVEFALRVALALECQVNLTSVFARKNYFYPDLPKGYQISQYEQPLAVNGRLAILTSLGERLVRIRRVHLEEDTGKLTHLKDETGERSLIDLNRAGVPLLEIVSEPDMHTAEEVRLYAMGLRALLRYLGVSAGDMQKGVLRIEPNISLRHSGAAALGTRTEVKNLNSFRALERSVAYEIQRQADLLNAGLRVEQQTRGWEEALGQTVPQRSKEEAEDYRYFPEPDLPPLVIEAGWVEAVRQSLPELPAAKVGRFQAQYSLSPYDAGVLAAEPAVADYYEQGVAAAKVATPKAVANWLSGELFALLNQSGLGIESTPISALALAALVDLIAGGEISQASAKRVLAEMFASGKPAAEIVQRRGLQQVSDRAQIAAWVQQALQAHPEQARSYLQGNQAVERWLFGQVMRLAGGKANPQVVREELEKQLRAINSK
jgi:aspartyl-tRNA(Asn)/glutamyl-tRNA(Gln) amidotransferase subunit B